MLQILCVFCLFQLTNSLITGETDTEYYFEIQTFFKF